MCAINANLQVFIHITSFDTNMTFPARGGVAGLCLRLGRVLNKRVGDGGWRDQYVSFYKIWIVGLNLLNQARSGGGGLGAEYNCRE